MRTQFRLDPRGGSNRYKFKVDFFKKWSNKMAYVLGFLYADGNVTDATKSSRTQYIKFSSKDKDILYAIKKALKSDYPISFEPPRKNLHRNGIYKSSGLFNLRIGSKEMFLDLRKIGVVTNKSKVIEFPTYLPNKYLSYFVRGYFDGDGSVVFNKKKWIRVVFTSGSKHFLEQLSTKLSKILKIRKRPVCLSHYSYQLYYFTQEGLKILNFIYGNAKIDKLYLRRKYRFYKILSVKYDYILDKYIKQVAAYPSSLRECSAKALYVGANPTAASKKFAAVAELALRE